MSYEYPTDRYSTPRRRKRGLETALILGFAICLLIGAAALGALWFLSDNPEGATGNPESAQMVQEMVLTGLAARQLAGDPTSALVGQAIQAGQLHTAAALLQFDTESTSSGRAGNWLRLAQAWSDAGQPERSTAAYERLVEISAVDLALRTLERGQLLNQAAAGLLANGDEAAALDAATQAKRLAAQAPDLLPAQRTLILEPLAATVAALSASDESDQTLTLQAEVEDLLRNPYIEAQGILLANGWPLLSTPPSPDPAVEDRIAARELAALNLAERYVATGGIDTEPERQALAAALLAEDQTRKATFDAALSSATSLQQQLGLLVDRQRWLALKSAVAARTYGISIVPEWEAAQSEVDIERNGLIVNAENVARAIADAQASELEQNLVRADSAYRLALESALGHYPGVNHADVSERLRLVQSELARLGSPLALPVAWQESEATSGFRIQQP